MRRDDGSAAASGEAVTSRSSGAARYTTLSVGTLRRLLREKKLRGYRPSGRRVLLDREELDELVKGDAGPQGY
jgi:excisionase family DNA binding protein